MCANIYARRTIPHGCRALERDFEPIHTETGLRGEEARKHMEEFVRLRMDKHWVKVPNPHEDRETSSPRPTVKSTVTKIDKVKEPGLNEKLFKIPKKNRIETLTREQTPPPPIGEDPQVIVTAEEPVSEEPVFDPPTRVLPTDIEYVASLETLTAKARDTAESEKVENGTSVKVQLPLNLDYVFNNDELVESTTMLETIMGSMTNLHSSEELGMDVTGYSTDMLVTLNNENENNNELVVSSERRVIEGSAKNDKVIPEKERHEDQRAETEKGNEEKSETESETEEDKLRKEKEKQERKAEKRERRERRRQAEEAERLRSEEKENDKAKGEEEIQNEEVTAEEQLEKEQRKQKREERKRKKAMEKLLAEERESKRQKYDVNNNEQNVMNVLSSEGESRENESETGNSGHACMNDDGIPTELENEKNTPVVTRKDRELEIREENEQILKELQGDRITLDVGGRHFATSRRTLLKADGSILKVLAQDGKRHYFIDRDGAHFRYILNYLREDCNLSVAVLPHENRYLMELCNECTFYKLEGLKQLVESRLAIYKDLGLAF